MQSIRVSEFYIAIEKKIQHLREGKAKKGFCMAFLNFAKPIYRMRFVTYSGLMLNASFRNISNAECYYLSGAYSGILTERGISFSRMVTISLWGARTFFCLPLLNTTMKLYFQQLEMANSSQKLKDCRNSPVNGDGVYLQRRKWGGSM